MTAMKITESWALHAYADGELDAAGRAEVERMLETDPAARLALATWQRQKDALKAAYDGVLDEPLPPGLVKALNAKPQQRRASSLAALAASLALLLAGGAAGWFAAHTATGNGTASFAEEALAAHSIYAAEVRHPVEVAAAEKDHLQAWLSKRVGIAFNVPDLTGQGYNLLGGRLLAIEGQPTAQLMYEDATRRRVTLYLSRNPSETEQSLRIEKSGDLFACYWQDGKLGVVVAGDLDEPAMMALARVVYDKFEGEG